MKVYTTEKIVVEKSILNKTICDICKKEINKGTHYELTKGHHDFNSEYESLKSMDICSNKCLEKVINQYTLQNSNTKFISIECKSFRL